MQADGVLEVERERGLHIAEDLSVVGYDCAEITENLGLAILRYLLVESSEKGCRLL